MDLKIFLIDCVCSDFLQRIGYHNCESLQMSDDEVLTVAIVSAMFFCGNHEKARLFLKEYGYIPNILSKSQLNRSFHNFDESLWRQLLHQLSQSLFTLYERFFTQLGFKLYESLKVEN